MDEREAGGRKWGLVRGPQLSPRGAGWCLDQSEGCRGDTRGWGRVDPRAQLRALAEGWRVEAGEEGRVPGPPHSQLSRQAAGVGNPRPRLDSSVIFVKLLYR